METEAALWNPADSWSSHPVYARYWQHYYQAMAWMRSNRGAFQKAAEACDSSPWHLLSTVVPQGSYYYQDVQPPPPFHELPWASQPAPYSSSHYLMAGQCLHSSAREDEAWAMEEEDMESDAGYEDDDGEDDDDKHDDCGEDGDDEQEDDDDDDDNSVVECDLSNMEITEELRQYFAKTERHREERRRRQQLEEALLEDYVDADHDLYYSSDHLQASPSNKTNEQRQTELKHLYGEGADIIHNLEATLQLIFDKYFDLNRPKYWPIIPIKF